MPVQLPGPTVAVSPQINLIGTMTFSVKGNEYLREAQLMLLFMADQPFSVRVVRARTSRLGGERANR